MIDLSRGPTTKQRFEIPRWQSLCLNSVLKVLCCKNCYQVEFITRLHRLVGFSTILQYTGWPLTWRTWKTCKGQGIKEWSEKSHGKRISHGKCVLAFTTSIDLDAKCAKKELFTVLGKVVHHMMYKQRLSHWSILKNIVVIKMSWNNMHFIFFATVARVKPCK